MDKKLIRFFPIFLVICLILDIIISNMSVNTKGIWLYVVEFLSFINTYAVTSVIFYIDNKKNKTLYSIFGLIGIALLFIVTIAAIIFVKNINVTDLSSVSNLLEQTKTIGTIKVILSETVTCLKYLSIISLISVNLNNSIVSLSRKGSIITNIIHHALQIYIILGEVSSNNILYKASNQTYKVFKIFMIAFIIYQFLSEEDSHINDDVREIQNEIAQINNNKNISGINMSMNNNLNSTTINQVSMIPQGSLVTSSPQEIKFRNPALEEQQRRLAEEERQKALVQQNQQVNSTYQQPMPNQIQNSNGINQVSYQEQASVQNQIR